MPTFIRNLLICWLLPIGASAQCADIHLDLMQISRDDHVTVEVTNRSDISVTLTDIQLVVAGKTYSKHRPILLGIGELVRFSFVVEMPNIWGSYIQQATVQYLNDGQCFSLTDIGYFDFIETSRLEEPVRLTTPLIYREGAIRLNAADPSAWRIILPDELEILSDSSVGDRRAVTIRGIGGRFKNTYPIYATLESIKDGKHRAQVVRVNLTVDHGGGYRRGRLTNDCLLAVTFAGSLLFFVCRWKANASMLDPNVMGRFGARLFWASAGYLVLKNGDVWLAALADFTADLSWLRFTLVDGPTAVNPVATFFGLMRDNLRGDNYHYFFEYFADPYWCAVVMLYLPYALLMDRPKGLTLDRDKYAAALERLLLPWSKPTPAPDVKPPFLSPAKLGFLLIAVKLFYLPYLSSWFINNVIHQWNLTQLLSLNFHSLNVYILALFILTDTMIFLFGYSFESRTLKSEVRSVEPTLLGWIVCLWCYPPFNTFSYSIFDYDLFPIQVAIPDWAGPIALGAVTLCWGVFMWASVALGFKASNLTNRGIVARGPYRYCRHPAYTAKVVAWAIEAVFFGKFFVGLLLGYAIIYSLRAWTEERHLSIDPDYLAYKKQVPYRFIPGLF